MIKKEVYNKGPKTDPADKMRLIKNEKNFWLLFNKLNTKR